MNTKYNDIFDTLIKAYYDDTFDETLNMIITCHEVSPQYTFEIITSLCGVDVKFDNNYLYNLKKAITNYIVTNRIVKKVGSCISNCSIDKDNKHMCEIVCPFNAIKYDSLTSNTYIDDNLCVSCGKCVDACKSGHILDNIEYIPVLNLIKEHKTVIAAVDPSIVGQFGLNVSMDKLRSAFKKIGFSDMIESSFAADVITLKESFDFNKKTDNKDNFIISSGYCPIWVNMIKKYSNKLTQDISLSVSPMIAIGRIIKKLNPDAKVVFVGPCIAKKAEALEKNNENDIDFVLTFSEINEIFHAFEINPENLEPTPTIDYSSKGGRSFAYIGGNSNAVVYDNNELFKEKSDILKIAKADGINECNHKIEALSNNNLKSNFIEGTACIGGCVGGPNTLIPTDKGKICAEEFSKDSPIKASIYNKKLEEVLKELDINSLNDFDNTKKSGFLNEYISKSNNT